MKTSVGSIIPPFALLVVLLGSSPQWAAAETRTSTFVVDCYDVGQEALQGRPGVLEVTKGWRGAAEINRVVYDHQRVDRTQLEAWLKESGTYKQTLPEQKDK